MILSYIYKVLNVLIILLIITSLHCDTTEPPENKESLALTLEDVSCTEAWLRLKSTNLQIPNTIAIKQNDQIRITINLTSTDTLLYIDSLLPKQTYKFQSVIQPINHSEVRSNELSVATMDTTSHNFTWQTWTFGEHSSSMLYDVAIINENNIWAVGEIYMNDSLGQPDPIAYNAIHWDGQNWEVKKISVLYNGNQTIAPLEGIFITPTGEIILSSGLPYLPQGNGWKLYHLWDMGILNQNDGGVTRIWGTSMSDIYFAGRKGTIVHYNGSGWTKIESGTTTIINDIWGITTKQNKIVLYCPVASFFVAGDKKILKIVDGKVDSVSWNRDVRLYSTWTPNENFLFTCGEGAYVNKFGTWDQITIPEVGTNSIRGNNINDIFIVGDYGFIAHFNGTSWNVEEYDFNAGYGRLSAKGKTVAVVGQRNGRALIKVGKRN